MCDLKMILPNYPQSDTITYLQCAEYLSDYISLLQLILYAHCDSFDVFFISM